MDAVIASSSTTFDIGAFCFGLVIGWITYRTLRRTSEVGLSDIATVVGAVGGAAVLGIFKRGDSFGWYAIGLAAGFFLYLVISLAINRGDTITWMGGGEPIGTRERNPRAPELPLDRQ